MRIQEDDGSRVALQEMMRSKGLDSDGGGTSSIEDMLSFFTKHDEFFKARVFLELVWEYKSKSRLKLVQDTGAIH